MITVQLKDVNGTIVSEKEIHVTEGDMLVVKYPESMTAEQACNTFIRLTEAIEDGMKVVGLPDSISFEVIKIKEGK